MFGWDRFSKLFLWIWIAGNGSVSKIWLEPSFRACSLFWWDTVTERLITDAFCSTLFPSWSRSTWSHDTFIVFDLVDFAICQCILKWVRIRSRSGFSMTCSRTRSRNNRTDRTQDPVHAMFLRSYRRTMQCLLLMEGYIFQHRHLLVMLHHNNRPNNRTTSFEHFRHGIVPALPHWDFHPNHISMSYVLIPLNFVAQFLLSDHFLLVALNIASKVSPIDINRWTLWGCQRHEILLNLLEKP